MEEKAESDESEGDEKYKHVRAARRIANANRATKSNDKPTRIPYLSKEQELTGIKIEVNLQNFNDNYQFEHIPDMTKPEYDPRRHFSYRFRHSPPRKPQQEKKKKDSQPIVLDKNGTFSCIDEDAKYDLSFDTRYPNYFGKDFKFVKYPPTKDEYPRERPGYSTSVKDNKKRDNVFKFTPWRKRAEKADGDKPIERPTIQLSDLDIIDDNEPHRLIEEKDKETFYNKHFTRLIETGPLDPQNMPKAPKSKPRMPTNLATEDNLSDSSSQSGSGTSDEFEEIAKMLRTVTMETVFQTADPATKYRTPEEFIERQKLVDKEFKFKRPDKFAWYTFNYGEKVETPPPREQLHMFFDKEFRKWADPPPPSETSDEDQDEDKSNPKQPQIYKDCEDESHRPKPRPAHWIDFDSTREIGRPVAIYHSRDFQVYNTFVRPLWIDDSFDFEAPIAPHFPTLDEFAYEKHPSEKCETIEQEDSDIEEPPPDAYPVSVLYNTPQVYAPQAYAPQPVPAPMYQGHNFPQNYYPPVQDYSMQYQNVPQQDQQYYSAQRYPEQYNVQQMYNNQDMYRCQYVPQPNPVYYPDPRYSGQYVPDMYNHPQDMYRNQYVPQGNPMYYPPQRYPVQYNVQQMYNTQEVYNNQQMYRPPQNVAQYIPRYNAYQRAPPQYNAQEMYAPQEPYINQNVPQMRPSPTSLQRYPVASAIQYNIPETIPEEDEEGDEELGKNLTDKRGAARHSNPNPIIETNITQENLIGTEEINEMYQKITPNKSDSYSIQEKEEMYENETPDNPESYPIHETEDMYDNSTPYNPDIQPLQDIEEVYVNVSPYNPETESLQEMEEMDQETTPSNLEPYPLQRSSVHYNVSEINHDEDHMIDDNTTDIVESCQNNFVDILKAEDVEDSDQDVPDINETNRSPSVESTTSDISIINMEDLDEADHTNLTNSTEDESQEYLTPAESPISTKCQTPKDSTGPIIPDMTVETYASKLRNLIPLQISHFSRSPQSPKSSQPTKPSKPPKPSQSSVKPQNITHKIPIITTQPANNKNIFVNTQRDNTIGTEKNPKRVYWRHEAKSKKTPEKSDKRSNTGSTASNASSSTNVKNLKLLFKEPEPDKKTPQKNVNKPVAMKKTQSHPALADSKNADGTNSPNGKQVKRANTEPSISSKKKGKAAKSGKVGNKSKGNKNTNNQKVKQQKHQKSKNG